MTHRILVTGGAGFIGSHLAKRLLTLGYDVTIVDNLSTGSDANIPDGADFIRCDVSQRRMFSLLSGRQYDGVFHLAAQSSGEVSSERPELDLKVNTMSTLMLLSWCRKHNVPRFLYASSMAVYGNPSRNPVSENEPCRPLSFYGVSKLASENYIGCFSRDGLKTTIFRMFSVYGPGQNMTNMKQGIVSIFLAYLLDGKEVWVKGSGDRFRDFIYIDDVADAWCSSLEDPRTYGRTYNLATGKKTLVRTLVEKEIKACGKNPLEYPVRYEGSTPADQFGLFADITRLRKDTGFTPKIDLDEGLSKMVAWVTQNYGQDATRRARME
jgi:UDP-glucose 4-epimerase